MGVFFNDPNIETSDLCWFNILAQQLDDLMIGREEDRELVTHDKKRNTISCYVELHRNGLLKVYKCKMCKAKL